MLQQPAVREMGVLEGRGVAVLGGAAVVERGEQPAGALGEEAAETVVGVEVVERPAASVEEERDRQGTRPRAVEAQGPSALGVRAGGDPRRWCRASGSPRLSSAARICSRACSTGSVWSAGASTRRITSSSAWALGSSCVTAAPASPDARMLRDLSRPAARAPRPGSPTTDVEASPGWRTAASGRASTVRLRPARLASYSASSAALKRVS